MTGDPGVRSFRRAQAICGVLCLLAFGAGASRAAWVSLGGDEGAQVEVRVIESSIDRVVLDCTIPGFYADSREIAGKTYYSITLPGEGRLLERGFPELPLISRSVIIPEEGRMSVRVLAFDAVDLPGYPVAPSKGNLLRSLDPSSVDYSFDRFYQEPIWWPPDRSKGGEPYILRDRRGMVVEIFPFQSHGSGGSLRAARHVRIEVAPDGGQAPNALRGASATARIVPEFASLYDGHFLNEGAARAGFVPEAGRMLVITADSLRNAMLPFVEWKNQTGIATRMVDVSAVGNSEAEIDAYIDAAYAAEGLAFVLLVGDAEQVATAHAGGGASDPTYSLAAGDDNYPDLFVGRFSAASVADLETQVGRTIAYERDPAIGAGWYQSATGIASAEGPGDNGEYDFEHADVIRSKLLGYSYTGVDQIYDPGATAAALSAALNAGRSVVNYTGHGSSIGWSTTGFSSTDIAGLTNDSMLPFIFSVGCVNGAFEGGTCFAEAWLRARHGGNPTGAIATYMSSVNQTWDPPMSAQDAFVDLLVQDQMHSVGGLCYNGSCRMMDAYGTAGANMFRTWHIFGDPSLLLRTTAPGMMTVDAPDTIYADEVDVPVNVPLVDGALCALYANGTLYGSAYTDLTGHALIHMPAPPTAPATVTLTVTAYNKVPAISSLAVIPLSGPTLVVSGVILADAQGGDGDGVLGAGETADLSLALKNTGVEPADAVAATLSTDDPYVEIEPVQRVFGRIDPGLTGSSEGSYAVVARGDAPDQHVASIRCRIESAQKSWLRYFDVTVAAPVLSAGSALIDDTRPPGNGNGSPDPGETFFLHLRIANLGHGSARTLTGNLTCLDPEVRILDGEGECAFIAAGGQVMAGAFRVQISRSCPTPKTLFFQLNLSGKGGVTAELDYPIQLGTWSDDAEIDRGWTCGLPDDTATTGSWVRADPVGTSVDGQVAQPEDDHTPDPSAVLCFVTGNGLTGSPAQDSDVDGGKTTLLSPVFRLGGAVSATLDYWRWFSNDLIGGSDPADSWTVEVTANGSDWVQLERRSVGASAWRHISRTLEEYIELSDHVQFRFTAEDAGVESLVEAALDDLTLTVIRTPATDVPEADASPRPAALSIGPNPLRGEGVLSYRMEHGGWVRIDLFDLAGRLVRPLVNGPALAGEHTLSINGAGIPAGIYFVRLSAPGLLQIRQIALLH